MIIMFTVCVSIDKIKDKVINSIMFAGVITIFFAALVDTLDFSMFYFLIPLTVFFAQRTDNDISTRLLIDVRT